MKLRKAKFGLKKCTLRLNTRFWQLCFSNAQNLHLKRYFTFSVHNDNKFVRRNDHIFNLVTFLILHLTAFSEGTTEDRYYELSSR